MLRTNKQRILLVLISIFRLVWGPFHMLMIKWLPSKFGFSQLGATLFCSVGFIWGLPLYYWSLKRYAAENKITMKEAWKEPFAFRMKYHTIIAATYAGTFISMSFSLSNIQGTTFSILRNTQLLFTLVLSYFFTKRSFKFGHFLAVFIMLAAAIILVIFEKKTTKEVTMAMFVTGVCCVLLSAFFTALNMVLMETWFSKGIWQRSTVQILEGFFYESFLQFILLLIFSLIWPPISEFSCIQEAFGKPIRFFWSEVGDPDLSKLESIGTAGAIAVFWVGLLLLTFGRFLNLTHLGMSAYSGALYAWVLSSLQRSLQMFLFWWVMDESFEWPKWVSFGLTILAFGLYLWAGVDKIRQINK